MLGSWKIYHQLCEVHRQKCKYHYGSDIRNLSNPTFASKVNYIMKKIIMIISISERPMPLMKENQNLALPYQIILKASEKRLLFPKKIQPNLCAIVNQFHKMFKPLLLMMIQLDRNLTEMVGVLTKIFLPR